MENKKSLVEEAIIQIKNLEEAVAENAKGILQSTMKEEINQLVKESLTEQEDEDEIENTDVDSEDMDSDIELDDMGDDETDNFEDDDEIVDFEDDDTDEPVIDLTGEEDTDEVLRVFQLMGPDDEIIVKKDDGGNINLKDKKNNTEYMIVGESEEGYDLESQDELYEFEDEDDEYDFSSDENDNEDVKSIIDKVFSTNEQYEEDDEDIVDFEDDKEEEGESDIVYEIEMDDEEEEEEEEEDESYDLDDEEEEEDESYDLESVMESKSFKTKGLGLGKPNKKKIYSAKPNQEGGFKTVKKSANKTMGTGNAKKGFTYKDGENLDGEFKVKPKKVETKEASRTYGNGSNFRKGGLPKPRAHSKANTAIKENTNSSEVRILREKNEEYRKALNVFRDKLNEVAVFNSNLAYSTRLFTEHTTTKQEKVNILKRFDSVETIKESKNLYHTIKDELTNTKTKPMNESIERTLNSNPSTGSAVNLIESKTYENPQFLRMKDLMTKLR